MGRQSIDAPENMQAMIMHARGISTANMTPDQVEMYNRVDFADNQLRSLGTHKLAVAAVQTKFKCGRTAAYKYCQIAKRVFNSVSKEDKEYWRGWAADILRQQIIKAVNEGDHKAISSYFKELRLTLGYGEEDPELPDPSLWEPAIVQPGFYPQLTNVVVPDNLMEHLQQLVPTTSHKGRELSDVIDVEILSDGGSEDAQEDTP